MAFNEPKFFTLKFTKLFITSLSRQDGKLKIPSSAIAKNKPRASNITTRSSNFCIDQFWSLRAHIFAHQIIYPRFLTLWHRPNTGGRPCRTRQNVPGSCRYIHHCLQVYHGFKSKQTAMMSILAARLCELLCLHHQHLLHPWLVRSNDFL